MTEQFDNDKLLKKLDSSGIDTLVSILVNKFNCRISNMKNTSIPLQKRKDTIIKHILEFIVKSNNDNISGEILFEYYPDKNQIKEKKIKEQQIKEQRELERKIEMEEKQKIYEKEKRSRKQLWDWLYPEMKEECRKKLYDIYINDAKTNNMINKNMMEIFEKDAVKNSKIVEKISDDTLNINGINVLFNVNTNDTQTFEEFKEDYSDSEGFYYNNREVYKLMNELIKNVTIKIKVKKLKCVYRDILYTNYKN